MITRPGYQSHLAFHPQLQPFLRGRLHVHNVSDLELTQTTEPAASAMNDKKTETNNEMVFISLCWSE